jgi:hypothetical protein
VFDGFPAIFSPYGITKFIELHFTNKVHYEEYPEKVIKKVKNKY